MTMRIYKKLKPGPQLGKMAIGGLLVILFLSFGLPHLVQAAPGDLDPTFGTGGKVVTDFGGPGGAHAVAILPDGKIVVAGAGLVNPGDNVTDLALARYNADGTLDQTFGAGGVVFTDLGRDESWFAVALQSDGKIVVGGGSGFAFPSSAVLGRFNPDGSPDTSFGTGGVVTTDFGGFGCGDISAGIQALALQPSDGKIVVAVACSAFAAADRFLVPVITRTAGASTAAAWTRASAAMARRPLSTAA